MPPPKPPMPPPIPPVCASRFHGVPVCPHGVPIWLHGEDRSGLTKGLVNCWNGECWNPNGMLGVRPCRPPMPPCCIPPNCPPHTGEYARHTHAVRLLHPIALRHVGKGIDLGLKPSGMPKS